MGQGVPSGTKLLARRSTSLALPRRRACDAVVQLLRLSILQVLSPDLSKLTGLDSVLVLQSTQAGMLSLSRQSAQQHAVFGDVVDLRPEPVIAGKVACPGWQLRHFSHETEFLSHRSVTSRRHKVHV